MSRPKGFKHSESTKKKTSKTLMGHKGSKLNYKGDNATYSAFHRRVYRVRGKADCCNVCGLNEKGRRYEWANLTGEYNNLMDYEKMCKSCHMLYDFQRSRNEKKT